MPWLLSLLAQHCYYLPACTPRCPHHIFSASMPASLSCFATSYAAHPRPRLPHHTSCHATAATPRHLPARLHQHTSAWLPHCLRCLLARASLRARAPLPATLLPCLLPTTTRMARAARFNLIHSLRALCNTLCLAVSFTLLPTCHTARTLFFCLPAFYLPLYYTTTTTNQILQFGYGWVGWTGCRFDWWLLVVGVWLDARSLLRLQWRGGGPWPQCFSVWLAFLTPLFMPAGYFDYLPC